MVGTVFFFTQVNTGLILLLLIFIFFLSLRLMGLNRFSCLMQLDSTARKSGYEFDPRGRIRMYEQTHAECSTRLQRCGALESLTKFPLKKQKELSRDAAAWPCH